MIEIEISHDTTLVRFGRLPPSRFDDLLTKFRATFSAAHWSTARSGWLISSRALTEVLRFAYAAFPAELVNVRAVATPPPMLFV